MSLQPASRLGLGFFAPLPIQIAVSDAPLTSDAGLWLLRQVEDYRQSNHAQVGMFTNGRIRVAWMRHHKDPRGFSLRCLRRFLPSSTGRQSTFAF